MESSRTGRTGPERRRNAVMMDALPDLPPSPSFNEPPDSARHGLQRRQRTAHREPSTSAPAPIPDLHQDQAPWTDQGPLVSSPEMLSTLAGVVDSPPGSRRQASVFQQQQQQQQPQRARAATEVQSSSSSRPVRAPVGGSVDYYRPGRAPQMDMDTLTSPYPPPPAQTAYVRPQPAPRSTSEGSSRSRPSLEDLSRRPYDRPAQPLNTVDERPMQTLTSAFAPIPTQPAYVRPLPAPRSTSDGSSSTRSPPMSAGTADYAPEPTQTRPSFESARTRPAPGQRSTSDGSSSVGSRSPPVLPRSPPTRPAPAPRSTSEGSATSRSPPRPQHSELHGPRPPQSRSTTSSSADSQSQPVAATVTRGPRHPHARAATDVGPQSFESFSSFSAPQPGGVRLVQSRQRTQSSGEGSMDSAFAAVPPPVPSMPEASGSQLQRRDGQRSVAGGSVEVSKPRGPRSRQTGSSGGSMDSTASARNQKATDLINALDPIPPSPIPEEEFSPAEQQPASTSSRGAGKFSALRALPRHVKGKTSASTLTAGTISPPISPPATQTSFGNREHGWARVRTHVIRGEQPVPSQAKSKLFQFQQIWGGRAGGEPANGSQNHTRQNSSLGSEVALPKSKLEEDVSRALWAARFGSALPRGAGASAHSGMNSSALALAAFVGGGKGFLGQQQHQRPESVYQQQQQHQPSVRHILAALAPYIPPSTTAATATGNMHERQSSVASLDYADAPDREKPILPREEDVLRALQMPFLASVESVMGTRRALDEERWAAFEGFEMVLRGWDPASAKAHLDRALWLIRAARTRTPLLGARILQTLRHVLLYGLPAKRWPINNVVGLQTLVAALFDLQSAVAELGPGIDLVFDVSGLTNQVLDGESGTLDVGDVEQVMGTAKIKAIREDRTPTGGRRVRQAVWRDAVVRCLELGSLGVRAWILVNSLETEWPDPEDAEDPVPLEDGTAFVAHIAHKATNRFLRAVPALLRVHDDAPRAAMNLIQTRVLPGVNVQNRAGCVSLMLELLSVNRTAPEAAGYISAWCVDEDGWRRDLEGELWNMIMKGEWSAVIRLVQALSSQLELSTQKTVMALAIPKLFDRIANTPGPSTADQPKLVALLTHLSTSHKQLFYKPVILCAAATKDMTVIGHLHVLQALARLLPDFWIADAELMAIALLSDNNAPPKGGKGRSWGATKIGQCVLVLQIIEDMRKRHEAKAERVKKDKGISESARQPEHAYLLSLEDRITVLLDARETATLLPFSQRLLIVTLLHEIRSYTLWPARLSWLARIINWTLQAQPPDPTRLTGESSDIVATEDVRDELGATISRLRGVYMACSDVQVSNAKQSRSTLLFSPTSLEPIDQLSGMGAAADDNMSVFTALPEKLEIACARFLVLVSQCLSQSDRHRLRPTVWRMLDSTDAALLKPACFLSMYLSEKDDAFAGMVRDDLQSNYGSTRRQAVHRLSSLFAWRFQVLSQRFIHKAERDNPGYRPLRSGRPALQFVPVDVGSSQFVLEQNEAELKARFGEALPRDVIRRLLEIDWVQENKPPDKRLEIIRTPFSVLPSMQLDRGLDDVPEMVMSQSTSGNLAPSPTGTPSPGLSAPTLLRRKSSASSATVQVVKRRPVFTPSLLRALPSLALSVTDPDVAISSAARDLLVDFMREDAATLCRPLMDSISGDMMNIMQAVGDLRAFLHVQQILPPIMSHFVFGHLAGFIRTHSKAIERTEDRETGVVTERDPNFMLHAYASTVPILSKLVSQVSNLGVQDLRRAKLELLLLPSGLLWFSSTAPESNFFPRDLDDANRWTPSGDSEGLEEIPAALIAMTMIRTSQNMLLLAMLKRNPQDITVVRKSLNRLVLPSRDGAGLKQLVVGDFIPRSPEAMRTKSRDLHLARISIALSRSYLLLVAQIFRCLPRTLSDRAELGRLLDGVNRILITHGDDIGIVSHALIACMVAATRFRRLFSSSSAFTLFMPSLIKVYCEATDQPGIRRAIEYALSRFYHFHEEVVIFQTLDIASYMAAHPAAEPILPTFAAGLVSMISSLKTPAVSADGDAAGIHGMTRDQEQQAIDALTVEKKPENLPLLLQSRAAGDGETRTIATVEDSQTKRFQLPDLVKFLLTIIAHDTTILRGEQFLRLLRCMAPSLYNSSATARTHLRDGIHALGISISQISTTSAGEASAPMDLFATDYGDGGVLLGNPHTPSELKNVRKEYLRLMIAFSRAGGGFGNPTMKRALELVTSMLRDDTKDKKESKDDADESFHLAQEFVVDYVRACRIGGVYSNPDVAVYQLREYAPVFQAWCHKCDFAGILTVLNDLCQDPRFAQDSAFSLMVMERFLRPAVHACSRLAVDGRLFYTNLRFTVVPLLCTALTLTNIDPIGSVEQCSPSPAFLAGIVLPLCLKLKTSTEAANSIVTITSFSRGAYARAWLRLTSFALDACSPTAVKATPAGLKPTSRPSSPEGEKPRPSSLSQTPLATLAIVLQIIKIVIIRGESDLSDLHHGVWDHIGSFVLGILAGGNAAFGLRRTMPRSISMVFSPSPQIIDSASAPRALDSFMWSMMHMVCAYRSPLTTQMRLRILETTAVLHSELKRSIGLPSSPLRSTRRLSSTMFAKPRTARSSVASTPATPEFSPLASPQVTPTKANPFAPRSPSYLSLASPPEQHDSTFRGRNRFPESVTPEKSTGKRILHLGLAANQQQTFAPPLATPNSAGSGAATITLLNSLATAYNIGSIELINACIRHVRAVQMFMGYDSLLLPIPDGEALDPEVWGEQATVLSKAGALEVVARETALLIQEFEGEFYSHERTNIRKTSE